MPTEAPTVEIKKLERRFGDFVAVAGISLTVGRGEIFGFLGPNGAGKSTTIRMLCGLLPPTGGGGTVAGFDILRQAQAIKSHIGYMSQRFSLYDDLKVEENLSFFGRVYGMRRERLAQRQREVLALVDLTGREKELTAALPAGLKQRLALASAVLHEPPVLFLDEPTSGADPIARRRFWDLIHDVADRGVTVFVTTHYMEEAEYCDRLGLIYRGELIAEGTPETLKQTVMSDAVIEVRCDRAQDLITALSAVQGVHEVALFGRGLHLVAPRAEAEAVRERVQAAIAEPGAQVAIVAPSMEDVFVSLVEARDRQEARQ